MDFVISFPLFFSLSVVYNDSSPLFTGTIDVRVKEFRLCD